MRSKGCSACALAQFCSNSVRWSRHHCCTSVAARRGKSPSMTCPSAMATRASCP